MLSKEERKQVKSVRNQAILDRAMGKLASRKLWVWLACTLVFLAMSIVYMTSTTLIAGDVMKHFADKWVEISMLFVAVVGVGDVVETWRGDRGNED